MDPEEIIKTYTHGGMTGEDNKLRAAVGQLTADRTKELSESISAFHQQLPATITELRTTITENTNKIIDSNKKISSSNQEHAKWMKWLTAALVFTGIAQLAIAFLK